MRPCWAIVRVRAFVDMDRALGQPDIAVDRSHDFGYRNRRRGARQAVPPAGTPRRRDQAGVRQCLEDLGDGGLRQSRLRRHRAGSDLSRRIGGQVSGDDDAVIGELAEDDHRLRDPDLDLIRTDLVR